MAPNRARLLPAVFRQVEVLEGGNMYPHLLRIVPSPAAGRPAKVIQLDARRKLRAEKTKPVARPPKAA